MSLAITILIRNTKKACPNRPKPGTLNINSYFSPSGENINASANVSTAVQRKRERDVLFISPWQQYTIN